MEENLVENHKSPWEGMMSVSCMKVCSFHFPCMKVKLKYVTETIKVACNYQKHMTLIATNVRLIINNKIKNTNTLTKKTAQRVL